MNDWAATKEDIDGVDDVATLIEWYDFADDTAVQVQSLIEARNLADVSDDDWFFRSSDKIAHCKVAMRRIEKRLFRLGFDGRLEPEHISVGEMKETRRSINDLRTRMNFIEKHMGVERAGIRGVSSVSGDAK